ncbi:MAG TPA: ABC transporter substrate-binding protein [Kofleriaceae bacterium]|nr:ABC transporter substrate-binding protein [Kofleriaceae bacterium]
MRRPALAAVVAIAACDITLGGGTAAPGRQATLVVARPSDSVSLDPARVSDIESAEVNLLLYDTLVRYQPESGELTPWLATSWSVDGGGTVWTFHLRPGVRFSDGTPVDAPAVAWNVSRQVDPSHPFHHGHFVAWDSGMVEIRRVEVVDPLTVRLTLDAPYAPFLASLSRAPMAIVSPAAAARTHDDLGHHPVGSGPYLLESWVAGNRITLVRNPRYWGPRPSFARLVFEAEPDPRQRLVDLESGAVDLSRGVRPDELGYVSLHPGLLLQRPPSDSVVYLAFQCGRPPFADQGVRAAIALAIDKAAIVRAAYQDLAIPASSPVPPTQWGHYQPADEPGPDLPAARRLLAARAAAGAIDLSRTYKLYLPSTPRAYLPEPEVLARALRTNLEAVGLHVELVLQPIEQHRADTSRGLHDLAVFGWNGEIDDPDDYLSLLSSGAIGPGWSRNIAFYRDDDADALLARARREPSRAERERLYAEVQVRLAHDAPWVPLAHPQTAIAARDELSGIFLGRGGVIDYGAIQRHPR